MKEQTVYQRLQRAWDEKAMLLDLHLDVPYQLENEIRSLAAEYERECRRSDCRDCGGHGCWNCA